VLDVEGFPCMYNPLHLGTSSRSGYLLPSQQLNLENNRHLLGLFLYGGFFRLSGSEWWAQQNTEVVEFLSLGETQVTRVALA
jgi:hypothetical protein